MTQQGARLVPDDYILGHSLEEDERLLHQGRMLEPATRRVFHAVGLRPGWTCLDIGCGPGAVMQVMGELTGPSGEVTGVDRDAKPDVKPSNGSRQQGQVDTASLKQIWRAPTRSLAHRLT